MSTTTKPKIPSTLPALPPSASTPWSADIIQAHRGLASAFGIAYRALNLDKSDSIRLGHHLKQAETFMTSIVGVFDTLTDNPLPSTYVKATREVVDSLVSGLQDAFDRATSTFVIPIYI